MRKNALPFTPTSSPAHVKRSPPLQKAEPSSKALLQLLVERIDDSMLREISQADYGIDDHAHLKALHKVIKGEIPAPMPWEPREVLELIRWSEPEDNSWSPGATGERGHWMRLFSCAILICSAAEPESDGYFSGEDSTIIQLVDSAMKLGKESTVAALEFLCWRACYRDSEEFLDPFIAVAILLLSASLGRCDKEMSRFLIAASHSEGLAFSILLHECQKKQTWRNVTRRTLLGGNVIDDELKDFGKALIADSDVE